MSEGNEKPGWAAMLTQTQTLCFAALLLLNVGIPLALIVMKWPRPTIGLVGAPIEWLSSTQCALLGVGGLAVYFAARLEQTVKVETIGRAWPWLLMGIGFFLMSADEALRIHERIRDEIFVPNGIFTDVPGIKPGDVVLVGYVLVGMAFSWFLVPDLLHFRRSLWFFVAAFAVIGTVSVVDMFPLPQSDDGPTLWTGTEEVLELWAQGLFGGALVTLFFGKLRGALSAFSGH